LFCFDACHAHTFYFDLLGASKRKDVTTEVRKQIYQTLLVLSNNGRLGKKVTTQVALQISLHIHTVQKIWKRGKDSLAHGIVVNVESRKRGRVGRRPTPIDLEPLRNIDLNERMTLEAVSNHLGISKPKLIRYMRQGHLRQHSNKKTGLKWCVDLLDPDSLPNDPRFKHLFDHVLLMRSGFPYTKICKILLVDRCG
jgi:hypothetical protein